MNCPKCKKIVLDVSRTFGSSDKVERDRKCPKCGEYYKTIERFISDVDQGQAEFQSQLVSRDSNIRSLEDKLCEVRTAFQVFMSLLGEKKKR